MIPKNIDKGAILAAIARIDGEGVPASRYSRTYHIQLNGKLYPPKYVISLANSIKNGHELPPFEFGGGEETNGYLRDLGFTIVDNKGLHIAMQKEPRSVTVQKDNTPVTPQKKHMDPEPQHERRHIASQEEPLSIVTVTLHCKQGFAPDNRYRTNTLKQVIRKYADSDVILLPAGNFEFDSLIEMIGSKLFDSISKYLKDISAKAVVCFGVDTDEGKDQLAIAIDHTGLLAMGRKFYPTSEEDGYIRPASEFNGKEMGYPRIFEKTGRKFYLAVCYDGFGIRHHDTANPGVDAVLILAHCFYPRGEGNSGDVDFARKGFAGASMQWHCPVFGTAVFFDRDIPEKWPTGVIWNNNGRSVKTFKYQDNALHWDDRQMIFTNIEDALCYQYHI